MDGLFHGKPYQNGMIWRVFPYFWFNTPYNKPSVNPTKVHKAKCVAAWRCWPACTQYFTAYLLKLKTTHDQVKLVKWNLLTFNLKFVKWNFRVWRVGQWPCMMSHSISEIFGRLTCFKTTTDLLWPFISDQLLFPLYIWQMVITKKLPKSDILLAISSAILVHRWALEVSTVQLCLDSTPCDSARRAKTFLQWWGSPRRRRPTKRP